jgi:hypothetical protein
MARISADVMPVLALLQSHRRWWCDRCRHQHDTGADVDHRAPQLLRVDRIDGEAQHVERGVDRAGLARQAIAAEGPGGAAIGALEHAALQRRRGVPAKPSSVLTKSLVPT